ncbi:MULTISPECIES: Ppx/GppA phosphatase family protein [unclassified Campylobacter]|uniref:Ppx/GppA phosphatase family protein n=1 Tax=unclassified Campylobacter TaxID=2593542 RepID=UPI0022E9FAB2|nr:MULTISPECIES: disulfide bond formation protein DsbA [unclassified Campylobacter]MDA3078927.1 disulfide bond formation protein DsbA [Campylobacter sp. CS_NA2]MDA3080782.1 disulfide bond formation protein DsbA [Campylobacter sp. CS_NA1]MDA3085014.1 disulfide bond formation protein DsbA [Campylobacter sp. CS_ED1]MDA3089790.1 disulfide bond formation protein DsbA [Campylobacter sp. CS_ED2]WBR51653.1 disulfide bond formation protein DsbA [Campylobacter sp. CS_NA3]
MIFGIDLGSNTLRGVLMNKNGEIVKSAEFIVGSARNLQAGGDLDPDAITRIKSALKKMDKIFDFKSCENSVCVATEAFRMAKNSAEFFDEIWREFGVEFKIIGGDDEAKFVRLGILNRLKLLNLNAKNPLCIDLGGASTEISNNERSKSFKFGIVRFCNEFSEFNDKMKNANLVVSEARNFINSLKFDRIILTSGVPTTMVALRKNLSYESYQSDLINGEILKFGEFDFWLERILNFSETEAVLKLGENRKDLMIAGIMLLKSLLQDFAKTEFIVVDDGLREGICINAIRELNPA